MCAMLGCAQAQNSSKNCPETKGSCCSQTAGAASQSCCEQVEVLECCQVTDDGFSVSEISDEVFERMKGKSYPEGCPVPLSELRYVQVLHYGTDGKVHPGEIIVNKDIAQDVMEIFQELYEAQYPIERMQLIDDYDADDERSMTANNTSAFCYRTVAGQKKISNHGYGVAIDINPLYNPYVKVRDDGSSFVQPEAGRPYTDRRKDYPMKIDKNDLAYKLFTQRGFTWGGDWQSLKDYQHFEKPKK